MILFLTAIRLGPRRAPARRPATPWQRQPRSVRFLQNLFDLSVRPATKRAFAARCGLLVGFALVCHSLGAGAALFVRAAPLSAMVLFGALFLFTATNWQSRD